MTSVNRVKANWQNWMFPSVPAIIFFLIFYDSLLFMPQIINAGDSDLGRHLTTGIYILQTGQIPTHDIFSHTMPGEPLVPKEWLGQVIFALAYQAAGMNGVAWLTAFVLALSFALLTFFIQAGGVSAPIAGVAGYFASIVSSIHKLARVHIFSWLFFVICLGILENYRRTQDRRKLIFLFPLIVVWANLHGAFIMGLMLVLLYAVGALLEKQIRQCLELCGALAAMLVLSCINPVGGQLVLHNLGILQSRLYMDITVEYLSPNFHSPSVFPFAGLLLFSLVVAWRSRHQLEWTPIVLLAAWTAFALYMARNIPLYAMVAVWMITPVAVEELAVLSPRLSRSLEQMGEVARKTWGWHWAVIGTVILIVLNAQGVNFDIWGQGNRFDPKVFPVAAVDHVVEWKLQGNMFNEFNWGGYLEYRLFPRDPVFIDGWTDFYSEALTLDYVKIIDAKPGWDDLLSRYNVNWVIVSPKSSLAARLDESPSWTQRYRDDTAGIWVRR